MKVKLIFCLVIIFGFFGCMGSGGDRPLIERWRQMGGVGKWRIYSGNPIVSPGNAGAWDSWAVMSMTVVRVGDVFHLYYEGGLSGCGDLAIGHAVSTDGLNWVKDALNPVLVPGAKGQWDGGATWDPFVIYEDGSFKMWYGGERVGRRDFQCGYAVSKDGTRFSKKGKISTFEVGDIGDMHVCHDTQSGKYYMYYWDRSLGTADRLRVAVSENETDFDFANARSIRIKGETAGHRYTHVFKDGKTWYMFYGYENKPKTGFAKSSDGLNWRMVYNQLLPSEDAEILPIEDDLYFMFYCPMGLQDEAGCDIRLAILVGSLESVVR